MNDKQREEFDRDFSVAYYPSGQEFGNSYAPDKVKAWIDKAIQEALTEERERLRAKGRKILLEARGEQKYGIPEYVPTTPEMLRDSYVKGMDDVLHLLNKHDDENINELPPVDVRLRK